MSKKSEYFQKFCIWVESCLIFADIETLSSGLNLDAKKVEKWQKTHKIQDFYKKLYEETDKKIKESDLVNASILLEGYYMKQTNNSFSNILEEL